VEAVRRIGWPEMSDMRRRKREKERKREREKERGREREREREKEAITHACNYMQRL
jgi:hypothetical protein